MGFCPFDGQKHGEIGSEAVSRIEIAESRRRRGPLVAIPAKRESNVQKSGPAWSRIEVSIVSKCSIASMKALYRKETPQTGLVWGVSRCLVTFQDLQNGRNVDF